RLRLDRNFRIRSAFSDASRTANESGASTHIRCNSARASTSPGHLRPVGGWIGCFQSRGEFRSICLIEATSPGFFGCKCIEHGQHAGRGIPRAGIRHPPSGFSDNYRFVWRKNAQWRATRIANYNRRLGFGHDSSLFARQNGFRHNSPACSAYHEPSSYGQLDQCPTYLAYSVRARSTSLVPLIIARPSGKTVNSNGSPFSSNWNFSRNLLKVTTPLARSTAASCSKSSLPDARWLTCTALRPQRVVVCVPCAPSSHSKSRLAQQGHSPLRPASGATFTRRLVFSQTSIISNSRLMTALLPERI